MKLLLAATKLHENLHLLDEFPYPIIASPKLDGIRSVRRYGTVGPLPLQYSRSTDDKPHPNEFIQKFCVGLPVGLDGEMLGSRIVDLPKAEQRKLEKASKAGTLDPKLVHFINPKKHEYLSVYSLSQSACQTIAGEPDFTYRLFDTFTDLDAENPQFVFDWPYEKRIARLMEWYDGLDQERYSRVQIHEQRLIYSKVELLAYEEECLELGYEGIMIRFLHNGYKQGRFSLNFIKDKRQGGLIKLKREIINGEHVPILDSEALIIGYTEEMHNANEARRDPGGRLRRQSLQENMIGKGRVGALICWDPMWPKTFRLRGNISHALAQEIWDNPDDWVGSYVKYNYHERGSGQRPRFPQYMAHLSKDEIHTEELLHPPEFDEKFEIIE